MAANPSSHQAPEGVTVEKLLIEATLDYLGFACGIGFAIEAKREGGKPTRRQLVAIDQIQKSRTKVFVINSREAVDAMWEWLSSIG